MKESLINIFTKNELITIIGVLVGGYVVFGKFVISKILKTINTQWEEVQRRLNKIEITLEKNNTVTNACLFNDLDNMLRKAEITNIWSSSLSEQWEIMYARYLESGDGLDGGASLRKRADSIEINDLKYAENIIRYNKFKKDAIENQKEI